MCCLTGNRAFQSVNIFLYTQNSHTVNAIHLPFFTKTVTQILQKFHYVLPFKAQNRGLAADAHSAVAEKMACRDLFIIRNAYAFWELRTVF